MKLKSIFSARVIVFQKKLQELNCDLFLIENPIDIFYFTGIDLSAGELWIHKKDLCLFVDGRYFEAAKEISHCPIRSLKKEEMIFLFNSSPWKDTQRIGFDSLSTSFARFQALTLFFGEIKEESALIPIAGAVKKIREIKDESEIDLLRDSANLLARGFSFLKDQIEVGIEERELALAFEIFCKKEGAEALSFSPIIAFGENSAFPHHRSSQRKLKNGDTILIDIGVCLNKYCSDMTRVLFFGEGPSEITQIYSIVKEAHHEALKKCHPGTLIRDLDQAARSVIAKHGYEKYFLHSLGHGIGLEVHEYPSLKPSDDLSILKKGMVLTIEPGIYLKGLGGVRYEDTILITEAGFENFYSVS